MGGVHSESTASKDSVSVPDVEGHEDWVNVYVAAEDTLKYNAKNSYAICAGIGNQLYTSSSNLGLAADNDATVIYKTLTQHLHFPEHQVQLFTSEREAGTGEKIKSTLKSFASKVPNDGVLLFQFSGHCAQGQKNEAVLIPADYNQSMKTVITMDDLNEAVNETNAKYVIMLLDCCFAGKVAEDLLYGHRLSVPTYVLAACNSREKSLSAVDLGNGFFTYFVNKYLQDSALSGEFPANPCIQYCRPLVEALTALLRPGRKGVETMTPLSVFNNVETVQTLMKSSPDEDEVDAAMLSGGFSYVFQYLNLSRPIGKGCQQPSVPVFVCNWLLSTAEPALSDLHSAGVLTTDEVYTTVLAFISQSVAAMLCEADSVVSEMEVLTRSDTFLLCYLCVCQTFQHIDQDSLDLIPSLQHMEFCLEYYVRKVCQTKEVKFEDAIFEDIIKLLTQILLELRLQGTPLIRDIQKERERERLPPSDDEVDAESKARKKREKLCQTGSGDEVDAASVAKLEAKFILNNLPEISKVPKLPPLQFHNLQQ